MTTRCKFKLMSVKEVYYNKEMREFTFNAQYDTSIPEDARFSRFTPQGTFTMLVDNPAVVEKFKLGADYYFDITEVPEEVKTDA